MKHVNRKHNGLSNSYLVLEELDSNYYIVNRVNKHKLFSKKYIKDNHVLGIPAFNGNPIESTLDDSDKLPKWIYPDHKEKMTLLEPLTNKTFELKNIGIDNYEKFDTYENFGFGEKRRSFKYHYTGKAYRYSVVQGTKNPWDPIDFYADILYFPDKFDIEKEEGKEHPELHWVILDSKNEIVKYNFGFASVMRIIMNKVLGGYDDIK